MIEYLGLIHKMAKKYQKAAQPWELLLVSDDFRHDLSIPFDGASRVIQIKLPGVLKRVQPLLRGRGVTFTSDRKGKAGSCMIYIK